MFGTLPHFLVMSSKIGFTSGVALSFGTGFTTAMLSSFFLVHEHRRSGTSCRRSMLSDHFFLAQRGERRAVVAVLGQDVVGMLAVERRGATYAWRHPRDLHGRADPRNAATSGL